MIAALAARFKTSKSVAIRLSLLYTLLTAPKRATAQSLRNMQKAHGVIGKALGKALFGRAVVPSLASMSKTASKMSR